MADILQLIIDELNKGNVVPCEAYLLSSSPLTNDDIKVGQELQRKRENETS